MDDTHDVFQYFTSWLVLSTCISTTGSSLLVGYNTAVINSPTEIIISFYNETYWSRDGYQMSDNMLYLLWSITVSIYVLSGMFGGLSCGVVADYFGRKKGLLFNNSFLFVGALLEGFAKPAMLPEMLILGRCFIGFNCGMTVGLVSLYLTEISPKQVRGAIGSCHQLLVTLGILIAQFLGLREVLGTEALWPVLLGITAVPGLIMTLVLPFCPESPRYLLLKRGNKEAATKALQLLRGKDNVKDELDEMTIEAKETQTTGVAFRFINLFRFRELQKPMMVAIMIQIAQAWSGINAIFYYSESIFRKSGISRENVPYAIVGTGIVNVIVTIISLPLVEKVGRRTLLLGPMLLMIISAIMLTVSLNLQAWLGWMAYVSMTCIVLFIIGFSLGLGPIPPLITAEMFRQQPRPAAMAVGQVVNWLSNFIIAMTFKFMQQALGAYTFLIFLFVLMVSAGFFYLVLPETKNRTFDEIAKDLELQVGSVRRSASRMSTRLFMRDGSLRDPASQPVTPSSEVMEFNHANNVNSGHV